MKIVVCVKQVPATDRASIDRATGTIDRAEARRRINPDDMHALEFALDLKDRFGGSVVALTMGPPQASEALVEACAFGCDEAVLLTDRRLAGSDALATGKALALCLRRMAPWDCIVTGIESSDGGTGSVSYFLSEILAIPHVTRIHEIDVTGAEALVERIYGHEYQKIRIRTPLICAVGRRSNTVRFPSLSGIQSAWSRPLTTFSIDDISLAEIECGAKGSPTVVLNYETLSHKRETTIIDGSAGEKAAALVQIMKMRGILRF